VRFDSATVDHVAIDGGSHLERPRNTHNSADSDADPNSDTGTNLGF
jgi:hypothetical protein